MAVMLQVIALLPAPEIIFAAAPSPREFAAAGFRSGPLSCSANNESWSAFEKIVHFILIIHPENRSTYE